MIKLENYNSSNLKWLVELNNQCVPMVDPHDEKSMSINLSYCCSTLIASKDGAPLGAVMLMREGTQYHSRSYAWHSIQNVQHLYVDRIIVSDKARGLGIGRLLYQEAMKTAKIAKIPLTAEVNTIPDNPQSHAFHLALGFNAVGEIEHEPGYAVRFYKYEAGK